MPLLLFGFFSGYFLKTAKFWVGHRVGHRVGPGPGHGLAQVLYTPLCFSLFVLDQELDYLILTD